MISSSSLIHGLLISLTKFFYSCVEVGRKLKTHFSSLLHSTFNLLTTYYNTYSYYGAKLCLLYKEAADDVDV